MSAVLDVLVVGAGPCGLAVAARLHEETPSAMFTDEEHQRYHWISKHSGRMPLVQARKGGIKGIKAEKWDRQRAKVVDGKRGGNGGGGSPKSRSRRRGGRDATPEEEEEEDNMGREPPGLSTSPGTESSFSTRDGEDDSDDSGESPRSGRLNIKVLDSTGPAWMEKWNRAFRTLEIQQLRSPMFFHVDPGDRDGMLAYTQETGRERDLWEISGCVGKELSKHQKKKKMQKSKQTISQVEIDERDRKDYFSPSTGLFADYCSSIISRYGLNQPGIIQHSEVADIYYDFHPELSPDHKIFTVTTVPAEGAGSGEVFHARAVVLAIGPGRTKILPFQPATEEEKNGCCHSTEIRQFPSPNVQRKIRQRRETNVVVVGGGLSSAQIADMAIRKGISKVYLLMRSEFKVKHFDIGLSWMGKFKNYEKAAFWSADTDEERLEKIKIARNGGSITPLYTKVLKHHAAHHRVSIHAHTTLTSHTYCPITNTWKLTTDPPIPELESIPIDYMYFATGMGLDVTQLPMLQHMHEEYPIVAKGGLPCLTDDLMWRNDVPLFLTGRLAALRIGPGAPNLEGARIGAERIAWGMEELFGQDGVKEESEEGTETGEVKKERECFCGLGNRYAELGLDVS